MCDIGQYLFWDSKIAWWATAVMFLLNNTFIQGLHCVVGSEYLNTMANGKVCTVVFSLIVAIVSFFFSLPRTFSALSKVATFSAFFTFVSVLLATIFAAIEPHPVGYPKHGEPKYSLIPLEGTSWVTGLSAFLNISYTFIGQITLPSFIAEMKEPRDFWKSVTAVTIAEVIVFSLVGSIIYVYTGNNYMSSYPAFATLDNVLYKKVSFSFMIPTLIFLGVLYASVSARFIFFRLFEGTRHKGNNTVLGWASWAGILACLWTVAWIIAEVIPFFTSLLAIMSSLFDSFFGFIFWGVAYMRMRAADHGPDFYKTRGIRGWCGFLFNSLLILIGLFFLGPGTYVSTLCFQPDGSLLTRCYRRSPSCLSSKAPSALSSRVPVMDFKPAGRGQTPLVASSPIFFMW